MTTEEARIATLKTKIQIAELKGNGQMGIVRKWKREIRKLEQQGK